MPRRFRAKDVGVSFPKDVKIRYVRFVDYFKGFENVGALRAVFGPRIARFLRSVKVEFVSSPWAYMGVSDDDGHLLVSTHYLRTGKPRDIYLDVIHELVHIKQFMEGKDLFDNHYRYVERPTELAAYRHAVKEARKLGLDDERICKYLQTEWMSDEDLKRLAKALHVKC